MMKYLWSTAIMAMVSVFSTAYVGTRVLGVVIEATKIVKELNKTKETE